MKTALQELKEWVNKMLPPEQEQTRRIKDQINNLEQKEYEQMSACFNNGYVEGVSEHAGLPRKYTVFDDYYTTVFGQKPKSLFDKEKTMSALFGKNKNNEVYYNFFNISS